MPLFIFDHMNCIWNKNYPQTSQIVDFLFKQEKNPGKINDLNLPKTPSKRITVRTTQRTNGEKKLDSRPRCEEDEVLTKAQGGLRLVNGLSQRCVWEFCLGSLKIPKEKTVFFEAWNNQKLPFKDEDIYHCTRISGEKNMFVESFLTILGASAT